MSTRNSFCKFAHCLTCLKSQHFLKLKVLFLRVWRNSEQKKLSPDLLRSHLFLVVLILNVAVKKSSLYFLLGALTSQTFLCQTQKKTCDFRLPRVSSKGSKKSGVSFLLHAAVFLSPLHHF